MDKLRSQEDNAAAVNRTMSDDLIYICRCTCIDIVQCGLVYTCTHAHTCAKCGREHVHNSITVVVISCYVTLKGHL